jgi:tRNA(Glu) U13 pseudouridine synthase TruD
MGVCRLRGIKLGNFEFCGSPLQLGQLRGNTFRILMRDVTTHDEQHVSTTKLCLHHPCNVSGVKGKAKPFARGKADS